MNKVLLISMITLVTSARLSFAQAIIDSDFSTGSVGAMGASSAYIRSHIGDWITRDPSTGAEWSIANQRLEATASLQQKRGVAITVPVPGGITGNQLKLDFIWAPAAGASGGDLNLSYNLFGYHSDVGSDPGDILTSSAMNFSEFTSNWSALSSEAIFVDFLANGGNGIESTIVINPTEGTAAGTAGVANSFSTTVDLSGLSAAGDTIQEYDYVGIYFFVESSATRYSYIDDVKLTAFSSGPVESPTITASVTNGSFILSWEGGGTYNVLTNSSLTNAWDVAGSGESPFTNAIGSETQLFFKLQQ